MALTHILMLAMVSVSFMIVLAFARLLIANHFQKKRIMGPRPASSTGHRAAGNLHDPRPGGGVRRIRPRSGDGASARRRVPAKKISRDSLRA